jgi:hypothetical protein
MGPGTHLYSKTIVLPSLTLGNVKSMALWGQARQIVKKSLTGFSRPSLPLSDPVCRKHD